MSKKISRRSFLRMLGAGSVATAATLVGCKNSASGSSETDEYQNQVEPPKGKMTYRTNPKTQDKVSILGYGMMRLPTIKEGEQEKIDQEQVNKLVDYAFEHGVNYFDTSPAYCMGGSEAATGIALHRYPREKYYVATKLSNFDPATHSHEASIEMYHNSMKYLQVDYIDYYLLHAVGGGMEELHKRYIDNGMLDFLLEERKAGRIRNLGFSYHGGPEVFDFLLSENDKYHWDFVQIQLNYLDWDNAKESSPGNTESSYLYEQLQNLGIPAVIMEPLLGGRLAKIPKYLVKEMKQHDPQKSVASWAFRYAGSFDGVLTVLSGMTYMEHLKDNLLSYCPLVPLTDEDKDFLYGIAAKMLEVKTIPCNDCDYCMPCPYGLDIPAHFVYYNKCLNDGTMPQDPDDENYEMHRKHFLIGLDRAIPKERQANHCIMCGKCVPKCPQSINIPQELAKIDEFVEQIKQS